MAKPRIKKEYPENFRTLSGFFMTIFTNTFVTMVLGIYMVFLTDFSGIDSAMGKVGYAAGFGTLFLFITRIIDAIDDPIQGWIVDSAKECKFGKYRRFGIIGTTLVVTGTIMLFAIPNGIKGNAAMLWIWALFGYLLMDMGGAMGSITGPMMQKCTTNPRVRAKITSVLRMAAVIAAIPGIFFVSIVTALGQNGDLGQTATKTAVIFCLSACVITFIGIALLKEPYQENANKHRKGMVSFVDIGNLIRKNGPLWIHSLGFLVGNLAYGLASGVMLYFIKWYFCADMVTGEVDLAKFAALSGIYSLISLIPNFLCPFLTTLVLKIFKTVDRSMSGCMMIMAVGYLAIYVLNITGIMKAMPALLFVLFFFIMIPSGMTAMFSTLLSVECADYAEYIIGRNMTAITNSLYTIEDVIAQYNEGVDELSQIQYTDYVGIMMSSVTTIINAITYVLIAFVAVSLVVSCIMIGVITLISVQERTKEIGVLRAIGASKKNVSNLFNAETIIIGFASGTLGVLITKLLCYPINAVLQHFTGISNLKAFLPWEAALVLIAISVVLTMLSGLIPSRSAAKKDPVVALRSE